MNENIDLTKILKDCPKGTEFYHAAYGRVWFRCINLDYNYPIRLSFSKEISDDACVTSKGFFNKNYDGECLLFPSKDQRDWSKFTAPWYNGKNEQKPANKIEPRFKVGDWVVRGDTIAQIVNIQEQYYVGLDINGKDFVSSRFLNDDKIHLWTIQDAKDGDVLALSWLEDKNLWEKIIIFKKYHSEGVKGLYNMPCVEGYGNTFKNGKTVFNENLPYYSKTWICNLHPATKEQRDLLFQKTKEAGYKWNTETNTSEKLVEPKFDPKTLKPFDKVLVRDSYSCPWSGTFYSHRRENTTMLKYVTINSFYEYCIPYNDETKHLVGTKDEAPDFYKYWEE